MFTLLQHHIPSLNRNLEMFIWKVKFREISLGWFWAVQSSNELVMKEHMHELTSESVGKEMHE